LHVYKDYDPVVGGIENHIRAVAEAQAAAGHHVTVLVHSLDRRTRVEELRGVHVIKASRLFTLASTPIGLAFPLWLRRQRPDIVHLHFPYPWGELSNLVFGRARRLVITYHSDVVKQQGLLRWYRPFLWKTLRRADRIIATSPPYIESSPFLSRLADKCVVIPLGVDIARFHRVDEDKVAEIRRRFAGPLLLFVGRLRYYKGLQYLIEAMRDIDATLLVVGDGPMRSEWEALASSVGSPPAPFHKEGRGGARRVHFLTDVDDRDLPAYYQACDLFVLPASQRSEAFGTVLLEAMACGKPVISTELGTGTSWVNQDGKTGLVVPPADAGALAGAIGALLADAGQREGMGRAGRARVEAEFTLERMLQRIDALYRDLLSETAPHV